MAYQVVIDALSSTVHKDTVTNPLVEQIAPGFRESVSSFKYQLHPRAIKFLNESGINVSNFGSEAHPHPFHKSVETHLLHKVWGSTSASDAGVMFMKESKFEKLKKKNSAFKKVWNYKFTGKDASRYKTVSTAIPKHHTLFMHDALMYFRPSQILNLFEICGELRNLYASLVVPPESNFTDLSLYPSVYTYIREGKDIIYQPEKHAAGSYIQPAQALEWLKVSKIIGEHFTLKVSVLESWGPIHNLLIERCVAPGDSNSDLLVFRTPESILLPNPELINHPVRDRLIPKKVFDSAFSYVRSVRTLRETDPAAFLRTQMNKEDYDWVTASAWDNFETFLRHTAAARPRMYYYLHTSPLAKLISAWSKHVRGFQIWSLLPIGLLFAKSLNFILRVPFVKTTGFALFGKWWIKPQKKWYQLKDKKAPLLKFESEPLRKDLFGLRCLRVICDEYPSIFYRYLPQAAPQWISWVSSLVACAPLLAIAWHYLVSTYSPQALSDQYHSYFHPGPWRLTIARRALELKSEAFFPHGVISGMPDSVEKPKDRFGVSPEAIIAARDLKNESLSIAKVQKEADSKATVGEEKETKKEESSIQKEDSKNLAEASSDDEDDHQSFSSESSSESEDLAATEQYNASLTADEVPSEIPEEDLQEVLKDLASEPSRKRKDSISDQASKRPRTSSEVDESKEEQKVESRREEAVDLPPPEVHRAAFGISEEEMEIDSEALQAPQEPLEVLSGGAPVLKSVASPDAARRRDLRRVFSSSRFIAKMGSHLSCGLGHFRVGGFDYSFQMNKGLKLRGRRALFFSKNGWNYGHDRVWYKSAGWPAFIDELADRFSALMLTDYNTCLVNEYEDGCGIPFHADDESCYGSDPIVTYNVRGTGDFITSHPPGRCNVFKMKPGDVLIMPSNFQESHKHAVENCQGGRISLTFRHQLTDVPQPLKKKKVTFKSEEKSKEEAPARSPKRSNASQDAEVLVGEINCSSSKTAEIPADEPEPTLESSSLILDASAIGPVAAFKDLYPRLNFLPNQGCFLSRERNGSVAKPKLPRLRCLLDCVSKRTGLPVRVLWDSLCAVLPNSLLTSAEIEKEGLNSEHLSVLGAIHGFKAVVHSQFADVNYGVECDRVIHINHEAAKGNLPGHFSVGGKFIRAKEVFPKRKSPSDLRSAILRFKCSDYVLPFQNIHEYVTDIKRAKNLVSNMKNGFEGVMANVDPLHPTRAREAFLALDATLDVAVPRKVDLIHIAGFAGCGKSFPVQGLLKSLAFQNHKVAVPSIELRSEWKEVMNYHPSQNWKVSTWESSMLRSARVLVIDEVYKLPRGYTDLAIHADVSIEMVIILGDPLQGHYHSTHTSSTNKDLSDEWEHLKPYLDYYCLWSRRIPQKIARFFCVDSMNPAEGIVIYQAAFQTNCPMLCNSIGQAKNLAEIGYHSTTISASQGSTYDNPACLLLDKHSAMLGKKVSLVAVTRSRGGVIFTGDRNRLRSDANSNQLFSRLFKKGRFDVTKEFEEDLKGLTIIRKPLLDRVPKLSGKGKPNVSKKKRDKRKRDVALGIQLKDSVAIKKTPRNDKLTPDSRFDVVQDRNILLLGVGDESAPRVSTHFVPGTRRPLHYDMASCLASSSTPMDVDVSETALTHVYPGVHFENLASTICPQHDPELKEILFKDQSSNQFPLLDQKWQLGPLPNNLLAAKHDSNRDSTLLPASVEKRLRFRPSEKEYEISPKDEFLGTVLFTSLCQAYNRNPSAVVPFNEHAFAECIQYNEFAQLSNKTQQVIMSNEYRSDPDWRLNAVRIFSKTQHKVNEHTIFGDWKACQTLALMQDAVIMVLGPVKKYQRLFDKRERKESIYVHAGNTPHDLRRWAQKHLSSSPHLANDYTAFDQSQHGEAVVLEVKKMQRLSIPDDLIDLHLWLKTSVQTQFGPLTCMRLTGEPGTYDDNTDYNLAVLHTQFLIGDIPTMVSGDDSLIDKVPAPNPVWPYIAPLLALKSKPEISEFGIFCGYLVGPQGACRVPITLFAKLAIAVDDQSIEDKRLSYLTEFAVGHSLGEEMWQLIPEDQVIYQCACYDFFCRFCSKEEKILMKLGEPDESFLNELFSLASYISNPLFAVLRGSVRKMFLKRRPMTSVFVIKESETNISDLAEFT